MSTPDGALTQLRAWLAHKERPQGERLPPERELCEVLGITRTQLRKALTVLETNGELWRHVGKGTFIGERPISEIASVAAIADASNPVEVMEARLMIEPILTREAAIQATSAQITQMRGCILAQREAATWRQYESADNLLHRTIAEATGNGVLTALFDQLNAIRRAVVWGRLRDESGPPPANHHSFEQHDEIVNSISERHQDRAYQAMWDHLVTVREKLLKTRHVINSPGKI